MSSRPRARAWMFSSAMSRGRPVNTGASVCSAAATVSAIVLKLLAKNAEDRYQSSCGIIADLNRCQRELAQTGAVTTFSLGHRDVSQKFQIPQKLYGREPELADGLIRAEA